MIQWLITILVFLSIILTPVSCVHSEPPQKVHIDAKGEDIIVLEDRDYFDALLNKISNAKRDILISMYIFKTTGKRTSSANRVKDALIRAAKRGANVKVLLEQEDEQDSSINSENEYTAMRLVKGGVSVYFDSPRKRTHVKAIVIDGRYTFIGSHNLTSSALQHNSELSLMIDSEDIAKATIRYIKEIIEKSNIKRP